MPNNLFQRNSVDDMLGPSVRCTLACGVGFWPGNLGVHGYPPATCRPADASLTCGLRVSHVQFHLLCSMGMRAVVKKKNKSNVFTKGM